MLWIVVGIAPSTAIAQELQATPKFKHLTIDNGLSHNTVYAILQDKEGFIWAGTRYGLNRYDGFEFKVFVDGKSSTELAGPSVLTLLEDRDGNIWVGHKDAGISIIEKNTGIIKRFVGADTSIRWNTLTIHKIYQDHKGNIWFGTGGEGLIGIDKNGKTIAHISILPNIESKRLWTDFVFDMLEDATGNIWVVASGIGLHCYNPTTKTVTHYLSKDLNQLNSYEKSLCLDKKGNLWVGTSGSGLYKFNLSSKEFINYSTWAEPNFRLSNNRVTAIATDSNDQIWVATDGGGLNYFDPKTQAFKTILSSKQHYQSLNTNALYQLLFDKAGNLWVGTFNGGLNVHSQNISPFQFNETSFENGVLKSVLAIEEDQENKIWLGTDGEGLLYIDTKEKNKITKRAMIGNMPFPYQAITCLKKANNSALWVGAFAGGLSYYDTQKQSFKHYAANENDPNALSHNNVWDLALAHNGDLWIATLGGGLCKLNTKEEKFSQYKPSKIGKNSISSFQIVDVVLDRNEKFVWAASEDKGLNKLNLQTGLFETYKENANKPAYSLSSNKLRCIFQDKAGKIWIGTEFNGLNILDPNTGIIKKVNAENGLSSNVIHAIEQDNLGFIWVSTQNGIVRIDPTSFNLIDFGKDENINNNQYNPKASFQLKNGLLLFGGTGGFSLVRTEFNLVEYKDTKVILSSLKILNQDVPIGNANDRNILPFGLNEQKCEVNLAYSDRAISFEFTTNDLSNLSKKRFAYLLDGFEKNWNLLNTGEHRAKFSSLAPGRYKLRVKVLNLNNKWSEEFIIPIIVSPPFWKTWWFIFLCILLAVLFVILAFRYFLSQQKAKFQMISNRSKQEILHLRNEKLENDILAKQTEQEILRLQNENLERNVLAEKREQEILKLKNDNLEKEVNSKKAEQEILRLKNENLEREVLNEKAEQEILNLKNEKLGREVESKQTRLSVSLLQSAHKNQFLNDLKGMVQKIDPSQSNSQAEIRKLLREINNEINQEDYWEQFQFNFDEMHKDFVGKLKKLQPQISANDLRLCCFLRLELNNREIASILHITVNGVEQTKYRLKKKMQLEEKSSLNDYIIGI